MTDRMLSEQPTACVGMRIRRTGAADISTGKVDALNVAAFVTTFRDEVEGGNLSGLTASMPDPAFMPRDILDRSMLMGSRQGGMEISFPSDWLLKPIRHRWSGQEPERRPDVDHSPGAKGGPWAIGFLEEKISSRLPYGPVLLPDLATDLRTSVRQLQRALAASGTTFRQILVRQWLELSRTLLETTDAPSGRWRSTAVLLRNRPSPAPSQCLRTGTVGLPGGAFRRPACAPGFGLTA